MKKYYEYKNADIREKPDIDVVNLSKKACGIQVSVHNQIEDR